MQQSVDVGQVSKAETDSHMFRQVIEKALAGGSGPRRPMNIVEKIIARHAFVKAGEGNQRATSTHHTSSGSYRCGKGNCE
jgi:hypothetical protein